MSFGFDLKKEEDVKLYLENLGIEYRFSCYKEKRPDGCHLLGDFMEAVKKDFVKAAAVYKMNCDQLNFGKSCHKYGSYLMVGKGCKADPDGAYDYFAKGCQLGNPEGCFGAGMLHTLQRKGQDRDYKKAIEYYDKSCRGNHVVSCFYASGILLKGLGNVPQDFEKAFEYTKRACELNHAQACANLSQMYIRGDGVEKNEKLATKFKTIAVELQEEAKGNFRPLVFGET